MSMAGLAIGMASSAVVAGLVYVSPHIVRGGTVRRLERWCAGRGVVALTYDDGPSVGLTARVLDVLGARGVKATFFLLGMRAERATSVADRVVAEGHDVGCHTHHHLNAWKVAPWRARRDVIKGYETLSRWVGADGMFRPPYGKMTIFTARELRGRGARVGWWTVDSGDTWERLPSAKSAVERVRLAGGGVALLHDFDREGADAPERAMFVLEVTEGLLDLAEREGWRVLTLGEVLSEMEA